MNAKNAFQVQMPDVEKLPEYLSEKLDEEDWRKLTAALECETKIFSFRTDALKLTLDQMIEGIRVNDRGNKSRI